MMRPSSQFSRAYRSYGRIGVRLTAIPALAVCISVGVAGLVSAPTNAHGQAPSKEASRYLDQALSTLEKNSIHRKTVDWKALRDSMNVWAAGANTTEDAWPAVHKALRFVDPHSFLQTPRPMPREAYPAPPQGQQASKVGLPNRPPESSLLDGRIGLLMVAPFIGRNNPAYVDALQQSIREFDKAGACGFVVDLRFNTGGNMWPMLAGIGPLLGAKRVGSFRYSNGMIQDWYYQEAQAWAGMSEPPTEPGYSGRGSKAAHKVKQSDVPVALLLSRKTASAAEAVVVAFMGRKNVRTFGDSTTGMNTMNANFALPDGAEMIITAGLNRDRKGQEYSLKIAPDELVIWNDEDDNDVTLDHAKDWLLAQKSCTSAGGN